MRSRMQFRAGKLYGMTVVSGDAWQVGRVHIAYVGEDWNIAALEIRPERAHAKALGLRTRKQRERVLLDSDAVAAVGNYVLLDTPLRRMKDHLLSPETNPVALPWVLWMPVVSKDGQNLGIVEDAYIDTDRWKVDSLTFLLDRKPYRNLRSLNPTKRKRRVDVPAKLAILGDVILLTVRTSELKRYVGRDTAAEDVAPVGTPEGA